jgi:hypothetical protein
MPSPVNCPWPLSAQSFFVPGLVGTHDQMSVVRVRVRVRVTLRLALYRQSVLSLHQTLELTTRVFFGNPCGHRSCVTSSFSVIAILLNWVSKRDIIRWTGQEQDQGKWKTHIVTCTEVRVSKTTGSNSDDWIYWHFRYSLSLFPLIQRYRRFTQFEVHSCTRARILFPLVVS